MKVFGFIIGLALIAGGTGFGLHYAAKDLWPFMAIGVLLVLAAGGCRAYNPSWWNNPAPSIMNIGGGFMVGLSTDMKTMGVLAGFGVILIAGLATYIGGFICGRCLRKAPQPPTPNQ